MPLTPEQEQQEHELRIEQMATSIEQMRLNIEKMRQDIRNDQERIQREIRNDQERIRTEQERLKLEGRREARRQVIALIAALSTAFAGGAATFGLYLHLTRQLWTASFGRPALNGAQPP